MTPQSACGIAICLRFGPSLLDAKLPDGLQGLIEADVSDLDLIRNGRHYDALKAQNDIPFYRTHAQAAPGPVLETGCGTGRVTLALAVAGVNVIGLDVSVPMLEEAKRKAECQGLRVEWIEADCRTIDLGQQFALIIMPFNTLQFFRDTASLQQLFHRVQNHLQDGGNSSSTSSIRRFPSLPPILRPAMSARVIRTRKAEERSYSRKHGSTLPSGKSCAQPATIILADSETFP